MKNSGNNLDSGYAMVLANLEEKLANIEAERLAVEAKANALRESIASFKKLIAVESGEVVFSQSDDVIVPKRAFKGMGTIDAIEKYLRIAKTGRTARQIADGLREGGLETTSQHLTSNVRTSLKRIGKSRGFVQRGNSWWLAEWPHTPKEQEVNGNDESLEFVFEDGE